MRIGVVIAAGGSGERMGRSKQFLPILGHPMVEWTVAIFRKIKRIDEIVLVANQEDFDKAEKFNVKLAPGGKRRQNSVFNGLNAFSKKPDIVLIHDGARPLISAEEINSVIDALSDNEAVCLAIPIVDTVKKIDANRFIVDTMDRKLLWRAQTPQGFKYDLILEAYNESKRDVTDDSQLIENLDKRVMIVEGSPENIKITYPEDLIFAEGVLKKRYGNNLSELF